MFGRDFQMQTKKKFKNKKISKTFMTFFKGFPTFQFDFSKIVSGFLFLLNPNVDKSSNFAGFVSRPII